ncbi:hypothetical protein KAR91_28685 [Candidatus Pacearchaeota archaeon]|nr:hypothetical protein [Candidatus Pacearchaeota archaeon]
MNITKVLPSNIPMKDKNGVAVLWEAIKFAATQADEVKPENKSRYLNELLHALLNDKAQCFVRYKDDEMKAIVLTRVVFNKIMEEKELLLQSYYSFKISDKNEWLENMDFARKFAIKEGCKKITFQSHNDKIVKYAKMCGFSEDYRHFSIEVGL